MSTQERRERLRAERHQLILRAARELAETEGWEAVTTRRLADRIEYSQPVLYSHFAGKGAIVDAVALVGFGELAEVLAGAGSVREAARAYLDFAEAHPALYEAMFTLATSLSFGTEETPAELRRAFAGFVAVLAPSAGPDDPETFVETVWSALHGLAMLTRGGRLRPDHREQRLDLLLTRLVGAS
ncbi:TetR family transcriptional regulator [Kitasatospora sp. MMS16-BH015]|uniref:TetR/AcrR family transcriptional regulator n=1 Tax=Kitasatospora sp. MMS16-BH015 TaxID=2018025 RepID=UPI000CA29877|nr:TetR/AcrR family transcriptional regulator [Kitasatospora sp. MMS16-BH015]AUG77010.1 TetR family transcriptional regulator [Kitasatospora sp. MMS16-BH015]